MGGLGKDPSVDGEFNNIIIDISCHLANGRELLVWHTHDVLFRRWPRDAKDSIHRHSSDQDPKVTLYDGVKKISKVSTRWLLYDTYVTWQDSANTGGRDTDFITTNTCHSWTNQAGDAQVWNGNNALYFVFRYNVVITSLSYDKSGLMVTKELNVDAVTMCFIMVTAVTSDRWT